MVKIPTLFVRDESQPGHPVIDAWKPECDWVREGEGLATVKLDGTNVKIDGGRLFKRQKPKEREYDNAAYVPCDRANPSDQWAFEAFDLGHDGEGIYELVGPKIQGNPHQYETHVLVRVVPPSQSLLLINEPSDGDFLWRTFAGFREYLETHPIEGLVFHHPDGRMAKIKRHDFGLRWPS